MFCPIYLDATDKAYVWILLFETIYNIGHTLSCDSEFSNRIMFHFNLSFHLDTRFSFIVRNDN